MVIFKYTISTTKFIERENTKESIVKSKGTLNLTNNSDDYGEFIDFKISLNWKKRSYEFGIFYQPHNQAGGVSFSLFGFE